MTSKEAYNYLLGLLESGGDMRWSLVKESMDKIKELIDQQSNPTLSECIKEWEENYGVLQNDEYYLEVIDEWNVRILIDKKTKRYQCYSVSDDIRRLETPMFVEIDAHHLLSKTLKALENNNETK